jgi:hypothetical protein
MVKLRLVMERLKERSTWMGLIALAGIIGLQLEAAQLEAIIGAGTAAASLVLILTADK